MATMETASLAIKDTTLIMAHVSSQPPTPLSLPIWAVKYGIGTINSASAAPKIGSPTTENVFRCQIYAQLVIKMATASPAIKDTILLIDLAYSLPLITLSPLILDVLFGIGIIKFA
jgi:hypothetical protein